MADTGGPAHESGLDARVGRLMYGFLTARLPELATKAELIGLRAEIQT
jgi:hypothetical protein